MNEAYLGLTVGFILAYLLIEAISDDDDDQGGGMMIPQYQGTQ